MRMSVAVEMQEIRSSLCIFYKPMEQRAETTVQTSQKYLHSLQIKR